MVFEGIVGVAAVLAVDARKAALGVAGAAAGRVDLAADGTILAVVVAGAGGITGAADVKIPMAEILGTVGSEKIMNQQPSPFQN